MMDNDKGLGLALDRERYKISQHRSVEIRVGVVNPDDPGSPVEAWTHCITCDEIMGWVSDRCLFECDSCGHTVSRTEAKEVCGFYIDKVGEFSDGFDPSPALLQVVPYKKRRWYFLWLW